ncbi:phage major capsid protein [Shinella fusca]|uniref:HK97 family phage major capsid protein n=1 Tax=Shinella fusca TaxID=544480 RepID=A0A7W8DVW2_9HYPH|nr:phage major capsid protein [Shinella fusca]MBB5044027.1 HK97 family phage major capsid protein [Shinella fusca]
MRKSLIMGASPMALGAGVQMVNAMASAGGHPAAGASALLAELTGKVDDFIANNGARVDKMEAALDAANATIAALKIGGVGDGEPSGGAFDGSPAANAMLGFMRNGSTTAFAALNPRGGMSSDSDPDGGWTVPTQVDQVIQNQMIELSPIRRVASVVSISTADYKRFINRRGATSGWVGERQERGETETPLLGMISPPMGEIFAQPEITQRLLDDSSFNLAAFLSENVSDEFALQEGTAFARGDGIEKPRGYLTYDTAVTADDTRPFGTIQYVPTGVAGALADSTHNGVDVLIDLVHALRPSYRAGEGVGWMMNSTTASVIRKLKTKTEEQYLWQPSTIAGQPDRLLGYPIYEDEQMDDIGAGKFPIAFGNWKKGYVIVDRHELRLLRDPYTKKGWVKFYFTKRVGGSATDTNAIKLLKVSAS